MKLYVIERSGTLETFDWNFTMERLLISQMGQDITAGADLVFWFNGSDFITVKDRYGEFDYVTTLLEPMHLTALLLEMVPGIVEDYLNGTMKRNAIRGISMV